MNMDSIANILRMIALPALVIFLGYKVFKMFFSKGHSK